MKAAVVGLLVCVLVGLACATGELEAEIQQYECAAQLFNCYDDCSPGHNACDASCRREYRGCSEDMKSSFKNNPSKYFV